MLKPLKTILDGLYTMVNESDTIQVHQNFVADGKNDGSILVSVIGRETAFRFSFATVENTVKWTVFRRTIIFGSNAKIASDIIGEMDCELLDAISHNPPKVDRALALLTELLEQLENGETV